MGRSFLENIEFGGNIYYDWITQEDSLLKYTDHENVGYTLNYKKSMASLIEAYKIMSQIFDETKGTHIVDYENIDKDISVTNYGNGVSYAVNKGEQASSFSFGGKEYTVGGLSFIKLGE